MRLAIGMPVYRDVSLATMKTLLELSGRYPDARFVFAEQVSAVDIARTFVVETYLETDCTHLLMVDADQSFAADVVDRLIAADVDFIVAPTPGRRLDARQPFAGQIAPLYGAIARDGVVEVAACGLPCALVRRDVFEQMRAAYPELEIGRGFGRSCGPHLFQPIIEGEVYLGETYAFCRRWRDIGGRIHALIGAQIEHHITAVNAAAYDGGLSLAQAVDARDAGDILSAFASAEREARS